MRQHDLSLWTIPSTGKKPTSQQIEEHMITVIRSRAVQPRESIPSHRTIALLNKVNRNTALRAYTRLITTGWLMHHRGSSATVADPLPDGEVDGDANNMPEKLPVPLAQSRSPDHAGNARSGFIEMGSQLIDLDRTNYRHRNSAATSVNGMHTAMADRLKNAVYSHVLLRGHRIRPENMTAVRGRKECLRCLLAMTNGNGGIVVNTAPADRLVVQAMSECGARHIDLDVNESFLVQLGNLLSKESITAIYIRPNCSYPCCLTLDEATGSALVELAIRHGFYIIEEEDDHEFWWGQSPPRPLVQLRHEGHVLHCSALSRTSAYMQHLRVVIAPAQFITKLKPLASEQHGYCDPMEEKTIIRMLSTGVLPTISRQARLAKQKDLQSLDGILKLQLGKYVSYQMPQSGTALWITFPEKTDLAAILGTLRAEGYRFSLPLAEKGRNRTQRYLRLDFGTFDRQECQKTAVRLRSLLSKISKTQKC